MNQGVGTLSPGQLWEVRILQPATLPSLPLLPSGDPTSVFRIKPPGPPGGVTTIVLPGASELKAVECGEARHGIGSHILVPDDGHDTGHWLPVDGRGEVGGYLEGERRGVGGPRKD